ncbi:MAG: DUF4350 domain-containing protein [Crocosphaera sp.]|nr:DUF4350 domain-containing protein [Crocosphaera sp.]
MILSRRQLWLFSSLFIGFIILLTLLVAPTRNQSMNGSTFAVSPDGYAAWYEFMKPRKTPIERWKNPFTNLAETDSDNSITLLRVYGKLPQYLVNEVELEWVKKGNTLVILARRGTVTEAEFSTKHDTDFGQVKIETTRRIREYNQAILKDEFGAIIEQENRGKGRLIYSTTPYLAANAYKSFPGNFELLANLIESSQPSQILVDEYIHGYKDKDVKETQENNNVFLYLLKTPFLIILIQGLLLIVIFIFVNNNPLAKNKRIEQKATNNSQEYINALATVLQKAESREFVIKTIGKAEQLQLQKQLGLKADQQDLDSVIQAWSQQTKQSPEILETLLKFSTTKPPLSDARLLEWMKKWQTIYQEINPNPSKNDNR